MKKNINKKILLNTLLLGTVCSAHSQVVTISDLDFSSAGVTTSGLFAGSNTGSDLLRFSNVASITGSGTGVDLEVTLASSYAPANAANNTTNLGYGQINVAQNTNADFVFTLYETGTTNTVTVGALSISLLDLDATNGFGAVESVSVLGSDGEFARYTTSQNTNLTLMNAGSTVVGFTGFNGLVGNPNNSTTLTQAQRRVAVQLDFENVSTFSLNYAVSLEGGFAPSGRSFFIDGATDFSGDTEIITVPEPSSSILLLSGLFSLTLRRKR